jgi:hypothetical protein
MTAMMSAPARAALRACTTSSSMSPVATIR